MALIACSRSILPRLLFGLTVAVHASVSAQSATPLPTAPQLAPLPSRPPPLTKEEVPIFRDFAKQVMDCDKATNIRFKKVCEKKFMPGGLRPPRGTKVPKDGRAKLNECTTIFKSESLFRCAEARGKDFPEGIVERWRFQNWRRISLAELDHVRYEAYRAKVDDSEWLKEF